MAKVRDRKSKVPRKPAVPVPSVRRPAEGVPVKVEVSTRPTSIKFRVGGVPVATNRAYMRGRGQGLYMSAIGRAWKEAVAAMAQQAMRGIPTFEGRVGVSFDFTFPSYRNDVDGPIKLTMDALQGSVIYNDSQVLAVAARKYVGSNPGAEILVYEINQA